jgi:hypothetical protein
VASPLRRLAHGGASRRQECPLPVPPINKMHAHLGARDIHYWRSKHGNEVDFVLARRGAPPAAIECKWRAGDLDAASLRAFRGAYPGGVNYVVASDVDRPVERRYGNLTVRCVSPAQLIDDVTRPQRRP